jgi:hypothetical protein
MKRPLEDDGRWQAAFEKARRTVLTLDRRLNTIVARDRAHAADVDSAFARLRQTVSAFIERGGQLEELVAMLPHRAEYLRQVIASLTIRPEPKPEKASDTFLGSVVVASGRLDKVLGRKFHGTYHENFALFREAVHKMVIATAGRTERLEIPEIDKTRLEVALVADA